MNSDEKYDYIMHHRKLDLDDELIAEALDMKKQSMHNFISRYRKRKTNTTVYHPTMKKSKVVDNKHDCLKDLSYEDFFRRLRESKEDIPYKEMLLERCEGENGKVKRDRYIAHVIIQTIKTLYGVPL